VTARDDQFPYPPLVAIARDDRRRAEADEEELARLLTARSMAAWETLFERHYDRIYAYALARLNSREAAEDVAAGTFQRALTTIDNYSYRGRPTLAWLYGIARNLVKETQRSDMRQRGTTFMKHLLPGVNGNGRPNASAPRYADATDALVSHIDLQQALRHLTHIQAEVVLLRYFAGLSASETGRVIGRPETAVYALQARALLSLRRHLR